MNTEYQSILEEINRIEKLLNPPPYEVTELDHFQAKVRYFFDNFLYQRFHDLSLFVEFSQISKEKQTSARLTHVEERAINSKESLQEMFFSNSHTEYWDSDDRTNEAMIQLAQALSYGHYGECTGVAKLCERCCAELIYKLPPTKTWPNEEGAGLYQRLTHLKEMEKKIKLANSLQKELSNEQLSEQSQKTKL
jgi:hypothetical protein